MHIPESRRRVIRYYGVCSSVVTAGRARQAAAGASGGSAAVLLPLAVYGPSDAAARALRRRWAALVGRIYEVDPLVCPRCGGTMCIIAFLTEPRVIGRILKHLASRGVDARSPPAPSPLAVSRDIDAV